MKTPSGEQIDVQDSVKLLGCYIDNDMSFDTFIEKRRKRELVQCGPYSGWQKKELDNPI